MSLCVLQDLLTTDQTYFPKVYEKFIQFGWKLSEKIFGLHFSAFTMIAATSSAMQPRVPNFKLQTHSNYTNANNAIKLPGQSSNQYKNLKQNYKNSLKNEAIKYKNKIERELGVWRKKGFIL